MARLILQTAEGQQTVELRAHNTLGRHPNNTVQVLDKIVSKEHAIIEQRQNRFFLRDLGSLNGSYINGERLRGEQMLRHGDEITLGSTHARFEEVPAGGPASVRTPQSEAHLFSPSSNVGSARAEAPVPTARPQQASAPSFQPERAAPPVASPQTSASAPGGGRHISGTRIDMLEGGRSIGRQITAETRAFAPFDGVDNPEQLRLDYERLRISWELTREIALERDLDKLLDKILTALLKCVNADRGVILLREADGSLQPRTARRRDGRDVAIQISTTILNHVVKERASVLTHDASTDFAASKGKSMILNRISSAMVVPLLHEREREVLGAVWLDSESLAQFQAKDLEILTAVANQAAMFIENTLLAQKVEREIVLRERFSRLVAPNVAERMISGKLEVKKGGALMSECTVFNSDIRGFTAMSEGTAAEEIVDMLNEYFELMVETLFKYEGTLDKFMGDGIMAFWGAPAPHHDGAVRAVSCALDQLKVLERFNTDRGTRGKPPLAIGLGIHTGPVVVGYVGSSKALSYTAIGDTANTSARLCQSALGGQVVISEATLARLGQRFETEELAPQSLKGKEYAMRRFRVLRERGANKTQIYGVPTSED
jgi:adenylate cyclase